VALICDSGALEVTSLAIECIRLWSSQQVPVALAFASKGLLNIVGQRLSSADLWETHAHAEALRVSETRGTATKQADLLTPQSTVTTLQIAMLRTVTQVMASLSGLNVTDTVHGPLLRALSFLQYYHFDREVRHAASQALGVANKAAIVPAPLEWEENDVLLWLCISDQAFCEHAEGLRALIHERLPELSISYKPSGSRSQRRKDRSASGVLFATTQKLLALSGLSTVGRITPKPNAGSVLLQLTYPAVQEAPMFAVPSVAAKLLSEIRVLQWQELAHRKGFLSENFSEDWSGMMQFQHARYTLSAEADMHSDHALQRIFDIRSGNTFLTAQQKHTLVKEALYVAERLGCEPVAHGGWNTW
jgi:hypothetical protein